VRKVVNWDFIFELTKKILELGNKYREKPPVNRVEPFKHYFSETGEIKYDELDALDYEFTRREILARYLLVNVVLDQGPDMLGVRELLKSVTINLYKRGFRIFHRPLDFFEKIDATINEILTEHERIKGVRAELWAKENQTKSSKYNLFFAQSTRGLVPIKQVLDYTIHRWGVPLSLFMLLEKDNAKRGVKSSQPFVDYLEEHDSAEIMARQLKDNERYGLGSAIGDKACHLFAKMYVSIFKLVKSKVNDKGWTDISYEIPFDSNAGRVLFRTGFLLELASLKDYEDWNVIQRGIGKGKRHYIRVTNIRGKKIRMISFESEILGEYGNIVKNYLKIARQSPKSIEIQHIPNLLVYRIGVLEGKQRFSVADFDDGLIYIGTRYCFNHPNPNCENCPVKDLCRGHNEKTDLIKNYVT